MTRVHTQQEATKAMLALAERFSGDGPPALCIARLAYNSGTCPLPLLRAAKAVGLAFGQREFRAILDEAGLRKEQVAPLLLSLSFCQNFSLLYT